MANFEIKGIKYQASKLNAKDQWAITRRLLPVLTNIRPLALAWADAEAAKRDADAAPDDESKKLAAAEAAKFDRLRDEMMQGMAKSLQELSDADSDFIIDKVMGNVMRNTGTGWVPVWNKATGREMFPDIDMTLMLTIVGSVLQSELSAFFG